MRVSSCEIKHANVGSDTIMTWLRQCNNLITPVHKYTASTRTNEAGTVQQLRRNVDARGSVIMNPRVTTHCRICMRTCNSDRSIASRQKSQLRQQEQLAKIRTTTEDRPIKSIKAKRGKYVYNHAILAKKRFKNKTKTRSKIKHHVSSCNSSASMRL